MTAYDRMIREALNYYGFAKPELKLIRHNENITVRVRANGQVYVLRIHSPVRGFSDRIYGVLSPLERMQGEVELLLHLSKTAPFQVQIPVKNRRGEYITMLSGGVFCELLQWIEGEPLDKKYAGRYADELGALAAQLHRAAEGFMGTRHSYSHELVWRMEREFDVARKKNHISEKQRLVFQAVLEEIHHIMKLLDSCPCAKGLIHTDLSLSNVIRTPSGLSPIDFSLSGFGYKVQDVGMLLSNYAGEEEWSYIREGYERAGGVAMDPHYTEAFLAFSILLFVAAQHNRYGKEKWFRESVERWTVGLFREVLR